LTGGGLVGDASSVAYDALKMAVEHVLSKIREGKKLSTEDVLILYLGTIVGDLKEIRTDIARLDQQNRRDEQEDRRRRQVAFGKDRRNKQEDRRDKQKPIYADRRDE
jgi:hypothetical protein